MLVFPDAVGVPIDGRDHLLVFAAAVFNAFGTDNDVFTRGDVAAVDAVKWVAQACKRENLAEGSWGAAIFAVADAGQCTAEEAERLVRSLLSAGVDTTVNGLGHLMLAFATFPDQWDKLGAEPQLMKRASTKACEGTKPCRHSSAQQPARSTLTK